ncbi:MAG: substrate-binding domain-containing protein, partial [Thermoguttaceae bacterium]|nr:substrate-binding domain-containing protein [Thermoguttaceae bacterium]
MSKENKHLAGTTRAPLARAPRVVLAVDLMHVSSRNVLKGALKYSGLFGRWQIDLAYGSPYPFAGEPDWNIHRCDGLVARIRDERAERTFLRGTRAVVLFDSLRSQVAPGGPFEWAARVDCDNAKVGKMAAEYLSGLGRDHFAYVGSVYPTEWSPEREAAFREELARRGADCAVYPASAKMTEPDAETRRLAEWLQTLPKPTCIFAGNDWRGAQVLSACRLAGVRVP